MDQPGSLFRAIEVAFGNQIDLFSISFGAPWLASVRLSDFLARKASRYVNFVAKRDPIAAIMNFPKTLDRCSNLLKHVKHTFATLISFANQAHLMTTYAILLHEILSDDVKSHLRSHRRLRLTVAVEEHGTGASEQNATLHEEWLGLGMMPMGPKSKFTEGDHRLCCAGAYKYVNNLYFYLSRQKIDSDQAVIKFLNDVDQGATAISKRTSESDDRTLRDQAMKDLVMKYKSSFDELKPLAKEI
ncbi:hypothetical protein HK102_000999 [Quaeritorhiza haematococci]|nr:hypothetical protein HK102_000999 [Quaeritorhiza haematococci]